MTLQTGAPTLLISVFFLLVEDVQNRILLRVVDTFKRRTESVK